MWDKILTFQKLKTWDKASLIIYFIFSLVIAVIFLLVNNLKDKATTIFIYTASTQFFLYYFNYRSLRNFKVYLIWMGISLLHLLLYFILIESQYFKLINSQLFVGLRNTVFILLLFQVLQIIAILFIGKPLVVPGKGRRMDSFGERKAHNIEYLFAVVFIIAFCYFHMI